MAGNDAKPRNQPKARAPDLVIQRRVDELYRLVVDGAVFSDVREYVREQEAIAESCWHLSPGQKPLSDSQLYRYLERVEEEMRAATLARRQQHLTRHLNKRRNLYAKAVAAGDIRTALAVLQDEGRLLGIYERGQLLEELSGVLTAEKMEQLESLLSEAENGTGKATPAPGPGGE